MKKQNSNNMVRMIGLALVACVIVALAGGCAAAGSQRIATLKQAAGDEAHRSGLEQLEKAYATGTCYPEKVEEVAVMLSSATHNLDAIAYAGELVSRIRFHTNVIMPVAKSAATARREIPEFRLLAELAFRKLSESQVVIDLAAAAALVDSDAEEAELRAKVAELAATADCATVDEAIARVDGMLNQIKSAAK